MEHVRHFFSFYSGTIYVPYNILSGIMHSFHKTFIQATNATY